MFLNGASATHVNAPPTAGDRSDDYSVGDYNVENLYDFRDDPNDGCDFVGGANTGCPGVSPPFDYVPASQEAYEQRLVDMADQITADLHSPDILLTQEGEDQDICSVTGTALTCGGGGGGRGKAHTPQAPAPAPAAARGGWVPRPPPSARRGRPPPAPWRRRR